MEHYCFDSAADGLRISVSAWMPPVQPRAIVLLAHGAAEHAARYARFAGALNQAGYGLHAPDHRGHGRSAVVPGVFAEADGWNRAVADLQQLAMLLRARHPRLPLVLMGHSMGSLMVQQYLAGYGASIDAAILSGSTLIDGFADLVPLIEAEVAAAGRDAPSQVMAQLMGGGFSAGIENARTGFDWLSRDEAEVQAYIDDPLCGFELSAGAWLDMISNNRIPRTPQDYARIPQQLPIHVFAGDQDPINQQLAALHELLRRYRDAGLQRVSSRFYAGGRHEMLNETNRDEVTADLLAWLGQALP
jgi:alpha-beta hydrolase superfamily lysophospholipase